MAGSFERAIRMIDEANATDPNRITVRGETRPKEIAHAELLTEWVQRLRPGASEALLLAARAHHIRRWQRPRSSYPAGRAGYLRWRTGLHTFHADEAETILRACGYEDATVERVRAIVAKKGLGNDAEVQALEDGLCLVFLETQLAELSGRTPDEKMLTVLRKTWRKMSPAGRAAAAALPLGAAEKALLGRALGDG